MWNKNERDGKIEQAQGQVKQAVASLTGDEDLKAEGQADETVGEAKATIGGVQKKVGAAIAAVGNAVKG